LPGRIEGHHRNRPEGKHGSQHHNLVVHPLAEVLV
jgi:hypothetical protein